MEEPNCPIKKWYMMGLALFIAVIVVPPAVDLTYYSLESKFDQSLKTTTETISSPEQN